MTLYYRNDQNTFVRWDGQAVKDIRYPPNIEQLWSEQELADAGFHKLVDPGVPEGKIATAQTVSDVNGKPTIVYTLEDRPARTPMDVALSMRQLRLGLIQFGGKKASFIQDIINALPSPTKDFAQVWYDETLEVFWDHPQTQALMAASGIPLDQCAQMWLLAADTFDK